MNIERRARTWRTLALAALVAAQPACSDDSPPLMDGFQDPCFICPAPQFYCVRQMVCGTLTNMACLKTCEVTTDCDDGRRCVPYESQVIPPPSCIPAPFPDASMPEVDDLAMDRQDMATRDLGPADAALDASFDAGADGSLPAASDMMAPPFVCTRKCLSTDCRNDHEECNDVGTCVHVGCGALYPCQPCSGCNPEYCDPVDRKCRDAAGACSSDADCPAPPYPFDQSIDIRCDTQMGVCHAAQKPLQAIAGLSGDQSVVTVSMPKNGASFASVDDISFFWSASAGATFGLVLSQWPQFSDELQQYAIWGVAVPDGTARTVHWADGVSIDSQGNWGGAPGDPPRDQPLYLLVTAVRPNELLGVGDPIVFEVGAGWGGPGDACGATTGCDPTRPLVCDGGSCRLVCASHRDCNTVGLHCDGLLPSGLRLCE
jgi:hypothetical protein